MDNEKYELKRWNLERWDSLRYFIARINRIRRQHPALRRNDSLRFHGTDNDWILCYSKRSPAASVPDESTDEAAHGAIHGATHGDESSADCILVAVNLDWHNTQASSVTLDLDALGLDPDLPFEVHDLLTGSHYTWQGSRAYVELSPHVVPSHIFHVTQPMKRPDSIDGPRGSTAA
jgi:starch synthase (maltosyl-transferring)